MDGKSGNSVIPVTGAARVNTQRNKGWSEGDESGEETQQ